jgi:23S rRNA pseudouridine1911/1915/1917 synthase
MITTHTLVVEESYAGQRIDKFLSQALPSYSRSFFQRLITEGHISINHTIKAKSSSVLKKDDIITITIPQEIKPPLFTPVNTDLGIEIIAKHEHFLVINKPAPLLVHQPEVPMNEPTVIDWLLSNYHELATVGMLDRPGIVHRLDKDTSGLMLIARNNYAHMQFSQMFKNRTISKTYLAVVHGHPPSSGTIDLAIARHPQYRKKRITFPPDDKSLSLTSPHRLGPHSSSRNALTHYTVKEYFKEHALVEVHPITGRTHQIRVHFSAIGHPLVGDTLYGTSSKLIDRHALHATSLSFTFDGHPYTFLKEAPQDFKKLLAFFSKDE